MDIKIGDNCYKKSDYIKYSPKYYNTYRIILVIGVCWFALGFIIFNLPLPLPGHRDFGEIPLSIIIIVVGFNLIALVGWLVHWQMDVDVENAIEEERIKLESNVKSVKKRMTLMDKQIRDIKTTGHVVMTGKGSTVIIDSVVLNSFNSLQQEDPELAEAINDISGAVERSGNRDAGKAWARFVKGTTLDKDEVAMKSLWDKVVALVPDVTKLTESVAKISSLW